jgi:sulfur carrier protein ThiS
MICPTADPGKCLPDSEPKIILRLHRRVTNPAPRCLGLPITLATHAFILPAACAIAVEQRPDQKKASPTYRFRPPPSINLAGPPNGSATRKTKIMKDELNTDNQRGSGQGGGAPAKKTVAITVNGDKHDVPKDKMTAADLKTLLGIDVSQVLAEVDDEGTFKQLADTDEVKLRDGLVLISHGRGGSSS